jgi:glucose-fructose oxidoreductase
MSGSGIDRRGLLLGAGMLPLTATAASAATPQASGQPLTGNFTLPEAPHKRVRWAIVGLGNFAVGQVIPGFLASNQSKITAFVSGNPQKMRDLGARYGVTKFYDYASFDTIRNDKDIDAVYIALPVGLHAEYTIRALKAGKHVLCEKPMASTVAECEAMVAAARAANRQLGVAYRVHFEPNNVDVAKRIKAGELGTLRYFTGDAGFNANLAYPPHKWRLSKDLGGGGSMYDIGIYALNAAMMCVDDKPVSVSAVYSYPKDDPRFTEVEGGVNWRLAFASGIYAQGSSSYCYAGGTRQKIFGSEAAIIQDPASDYYTSNVILQKGWGNSTTLRAGNPIEQFSKQVDAFSLAARTNTPHLTPGEMGLRDITIIQAIYKSADANGQTVQL